MAKGVVAFGAGLAAFAASLSLLPSVVAGRALDGALFRWDAGVALAYHLDGLSLLFMLMATGIGSGDPALLRALHGT